MTITSEEIKTRWVLDAEGVLRPLKEVYGEFRKQEAAEKQLTYVREKLAGTSDALTKAFETLNKSMIAKVTIANLATEAFSAFASILKTAFKNAEEFSQAQAQFSGDLNRFKAAADNAISGLDLMKIHNEAMIAGVKLSNTEFAGLASMADKVADAMGKNATEVLKDMVTALEKGSDKTVRYMGVIVDTDSAVYQYATSVGKLASELTKSEEVTAKDVAIKDALKKKTDELGEGVETLGKQIGRATTWLIDWATELMGWWNEALAFQGKGKGIDLSIYAGSARGDRKTPEQMAAAMKKAEDAEDARLDKLISKYTATDNAIKMVIESTNKWNLVAQKIKAGQRKGGGKSRGESWDSGDYYMPQADEDSVSGTGSENAKALSFQDQMSDALARGKFAQQYYAASMNATSTAARRQRTALEDLQAGIDSAAVTMATTGVESIAEFTGGMWNMFDAVVMGEESVEMALAKSLKAVLMSVATKAWAEGTYGILSGIITYDYAKAAAGASLVAFGAVVGGAALGISYGIKQGGGYDSKSSSGSSGGASNASAFNTTSGYGVASRADNRPIYVNLYLDPSDPAAVVFADRKLKAKIAKSLGTSS